MAIDFLILQGQTVLSRLHFRPSSTAEITTIIIFVIDIIINNIIDNINVIIELCDRTVSIHTSYSEAPGFKSPTGDRLS
jgi:hypothetical protein